MKRKHTEDTPRPGSAPLGSLPPVDLVEDDAVAAAAVKEALGASTGFRFRNHYTDAESAIENIPKDPPRLVIHDIRLPGIDGIESIQKLRLAVPDLKIVMWTVFEDEAAIVAAIEAGATGYLLKETDPELLLAELKVMDLGGSPLTPRVADLILRRHRPREVPDLLTERELEVLTYIAVGMKYVDVARELNVSLHTVRRHIENIYRKLNVHSRGAAVAKGRRFGLLQ
ncbi:MAG: response regulator transcription factor [Leptospirales bacterium]|jgi:DNA-binding NarL/FixJ family response regulator